jgi:hypothetical protein
MIVGGCFGVLLTSESDRGGGLKLSMMRFTLEGKLGSDLTISLPSV